MINQLLALKHTLRFKKDGTFKIMVLADLHVKTGGLNGTIRANIKSLVDREQPDLILLAGDNTQRITTVGDLKEGLHTVVDYIEEKKIPWAHVYGVHDDETYADQFANTLSKQEQQPVYEGFEWCISKDTPGLYGVGNYLLPVLASQSDEIAFNVWNLDSGSYFSEDLQRLAPIPPYDYMDLKTDFIRPDQIDWYLKNSILLERYYGRKIPGLMHFNVPLQENYVAWLYREKLHYTGTLNNKGVWASPINSGLFSQLMLRGDIKAIANGHDHTNDYMLDYCGIKLCACSTVSTNSYFNENMLGARIFLLEEKDPSCLRTYMSYVHRKPIPEPEKIPFFSAGTLLLDFNDGNPPYTATSLCCSTNENSFVEDISVKHSTNRGINGSAAMGFTRTQQRQRHIELKLDLKECGKIGGNQYLRLWLDFTGDTTPVGPLKACLGLISEYNQINYYATDMNDQDDLEFYYLAEGETEWKTYLHDNDGCFGAHAADSLTGFKGWFAFPLKDMLQRGSMDSLNPESIITGIYLYFAFHSPQMHGQYVYLDDVTLVKDYKDF